VYADNETNYCPRCQTGGKVLADRSLSRLLKDDWPRSVEELDQHRLIVLGGAIQPWLQQSGNWLLTAGRGDRDSRLPWLTINNVLGVLRACQRGLGIAMLPDYLVEENGGLVQLFGDSNANAVAYDAYFVYPEELKSVARVQVFRDFLVSKAQRWHF